MLRRAAALALALVAAACNDVRNGSGYVEIRGLAGFSPMPELYLDEVKVETFRNGAAIVRKAVGATKLQWYRADTFYPICSFDVRKNRIVTLNLAAIDRKLHCEVQS